MAVAVHADWPAFEAAASEAGGRLIGFSKHGTRHHAAEGTYRPGDWLLFGAETSGLPPEAHAACAASGGVVRIPIRLDRVRSLNLAVSAGVGIFEALRQVDGAVLLD